MPSDVDAARGNIGGDQRADLAAAERRQHALAVVRDLLREWRVSGDAALCRLHYCRAMLGAGKDQRAIDRFLLQSCASRAGLANDLPDDALGNALDRRGHRVTATRAGSRSICSASSAISFGIVAEKNSVCR